MDTGAIPALGFGTLIPDPSRPEPRPRRRWRQEVASSTLPNGTEMKRRSAKRCKRCSSRERSSGKKCLSPRSSGITIIVLAPLKLTYEASLKRLQLDYVDLYLIHTPFAFQPGNQQDPRDASGNVIYDQGVALRWIHGGRRRTTPGGQGQVQGHRTIRRRPGPGAGKLSGSEDQARRRSRRIRDPYLPQWDLLDYCRKHGIVLQAFAALGHSSEPNLLQDPVITAIAKRVEKTPAQVLLAWAIQRGTALLTTSKSPSRIKENFIVSALPEDAVRDERRSQVAVRFNAVVETGVPRSFRERRISSAGRPLWPDRESWNMAFRIGKTGLLGAHRRPGVCLGWRRICAVSAMKATLRCTIRDTTPEKSRI